MEFNPLPEPARKDETPKFNPYEKNPFTQEHNEDEGWALGV